MISGRWKLSGLDPTVRQAAEWCLSWAEYYGVPVTITSGFRSWADQERLWNNYQQCLETGNYGRTADCKYPANRPGDSAHNFGWAWDSWTPPEYLGWWNQVRQLAGFRTYGNDPVHAEVPNWRQYR